MQEALPIVSAAPKVSVRRAVLTGAASWSDRSLVRDGGWYPRRTMTAAQRMDYYAARLPLVEIDSPYRFPPTPEVCRQWTERTPPGFTIDVVAWSLFGGNATLPDSLWADLQDEVKPELRDRRRLYASHLSSDAWSECWHRFLHAIQPLIHAGRLGGVIVRYPHWLRPGETGRALLREAAYRLDSVPIAVELPNPHWLEPAECENTLAFLEDHGLGLVCVDDRTCLERPPVVAATSDLAVVRFDGRSPGRWDDPEMSWPERYAYRYTSEDLEPWLDRLAELVASAPAVHAVFANTWRDDAVHGATLLGDLLGADNGAALTPDRSGG